jgi:hypothetical protein
MLFSYAASCAEHKFLNVLNFCASNFQGEVKPSQPYLSINCHNHLVIQCVGITAGHILWGVGRHATALSTAMCTASTATAPPPLNSWSLRLLQS